MKTFVLLAGDLVVSNLFFVRASYPSVAPLAANITGIVTSLYSVSLWNSTIRWPSFNLLSTVFYKENYFNFCGKIWKSSC